MNSLTASTPPAPYPAASNDDNDKIFFRNVFDYVRNDIITMLPNDIPQASKDWIANMLDYTVMGGKANRGLTVLQIAKQLNNAITFEDSFRAAILGWSIEFLQAFFLVADDVMDQSQTRRGQPCWYKQPHVKLVAINDSFLLESFVFSLLKRHMSSSSCYAEMNQLMLETIQQTELGQLLDLTSQPQDSDEMDWTLFTMDRYKSIVKYKTAFYSFYLPVAMGILISKDTQLTADQWLKVKECCLEMGEYFQIQDDYLDCFGAPEVIGKIGTDIQEQKCSWLVVQALERSKEHQEDILKQNYGVWDDEKVEKVKELYRQLELTKVFEEYEEESYKRLTKKVQEIDFLPTQVLGSLLNKIYKRSK